MTTVDGQVQLGPFLVAKVVSGMTTVDGQVQLYPSHAANVVSGMTSSTLSVSCREGVFWDDHG